jgi:hypothetical protein
MAGRPLERATQPNYGFIVKRESMTTRFLLVLALVTGMVPMTMAVTTGGASPREEGDRESASGAIQALDAAIQQRFTKVDGTFGFTRVMPRGTAHDFVPESDAELSSLSRLDDAHLRVALYLAGRRLLSPSADQPLFSRRQDPIKGPARLTPGARVRMPTAESLADEFRRAFAAFDRHEPHDESVAGDWTIVARPVRAANGTCLQCHRSDGVNWPARNTSDLHVGDVLGVVIYAYQQSAS